jgi:hypothetical protein
MDLRHRPNMDDAMINDAQQTRRIRVEGCDSIIPMSKQQLDRATGGSGGAAKMKASPHR